MNDTMKIVGKTLKVRGGDILKILSPYNTNPGYYVYNVRDILTGKEYRRWIAID